MVLAHSLIGVPISFFLIKKYGENEGKIIPKNYFNLFYFFGILGAVFPDFDLILTFFIDDLNHRKMISHSIIPYLSLFIVLYFSSYLFKKYENEFRLVNLLFFSGVLSHLLIDFLVGGISLFAPITRDVYGLPIYFSSQSREFFYNYFTSWYLFFEIVLILFSLKFIYELKEFWVVKFLPIFLFFIALLMIFLTK